MSRKLIANTIASGVRFVAGTTVRCVGPVPDHRQTIFFANHSSHLDFVVLWAVLPRAIRAQVRPVAAKDYWEKGIRRRLAVNVFRSVLVERHHEHHEHGEGDAHGHSSSSRHSVEALYQALDQDDSLIIFPEGTRGTGEAIAPLKSGIYHLWKHKPGVQFVPVYLCNLNRVLPKGEFLPVPVITRVTFGTSLGLDTCESKESFLQKAHKALCALREI